MFAAIREIYNIPRDESRKLRDYPTLAHVIRFVYEKRPDLASAIPVSKTAEMPAVVSTPAATQPTPPAPQATSPKDGAGGDVKERILALMVEKTGYPQDMLDVDLDLEADLGVDTVSRRKCSPPSVRSTAFRATRTASYAITPRWHMSFGSYTRSGLTWPLELLRHRRLRRYPQPQQVLSQPNQPRQRRWWRLLKTVLASR